MFVIIALFALFPVFVAPAYHMNALGIIPAAHCSVYAPCNLTNLGSASPYALLENGVPYRILDSLVNYTQTIYSTVYGYSDLSSIAYFIGRTDLLLSSLCPGLAVFETNTANYFGNGITLFTEGDHLSGVTNKYLSFPIQGSFYDCDIAGFDLGTLNSPEIAISPFRVLKLYSNATETVTSLAIYANGTTTPPVYFQHWGVTARPLFRSFVVQESSNDKFPIK